MEVPLLVAYHEDDSQRTELELTRLQSVEGTSGWRGLPSAPNCADGGGDFQGTPRPPLLGDLGRSNVGNFADNRIRQGL